MIYYIYTLSHPITNEVRYVGKTIKLKRRYKQHLYDKRSSHRASWVQSLRKDSLKPILSIIEECTKDNWEEREIYWIGQYDNLTNHKKGGNGGSDHIRTTKEETRKKLSNVLKGRKLSEEHKQNITEKTIKRKISVFGIEYVSIMEASRILVIPKSTLHQRLNSNNFPDYCYL